MSRVRMAIFVCAPEGADTDKRRRQIVDIFGLINSYAKNAKSIPFATAAQSALLHIPAFGSASARKGSWTLDTWPSVSQIMSVLDLPPDTDPQELKELLTVPQAPGSDFDIVLLLGAIGPAPETASLGLYTFEVDQQATDDSFVVNYTGYHGLLQSPQWFEKNAELWNRLTSHVDQSETLQATALYGAAPPRPAAATTNLAQFAPSPMPAANPRKAQPVADDAIVIRGGIMSKQNFAKDGVDMNGRIIDDSVQSSGQVAVRVSEASVRQWRGPIPLGNMGATTAKKIRQKGGQVLESPFVGGGGPHHASLFGLTPKDAAQIFKQFTIN